MKYATILTEIIRANRRIFQNPARLLLLARSIREPNCRTPRVGQPIQAEATTAFTHDGVDNLTELVKMVKADPDLLRRNTPS